MDYRSGIAALTEAQQQLVLEHLGIALHAASKPGLPRWIAREQIRSAAYWGLCIAAVKWEPPGSYPAFAKECIHKTISREIQSAGLVIGYRSTRPAKWEPDSELWRDRCTCADPLDTMIAKEERAWLRGAIRRLSPGLQKVIQGDLKDKPVVNGHKKRWKAVKQLRAMVAEY